MSDYYNNNYGNMNLNNDQFQQYNNQQINQQQVMMQQVPVATPKQTRRRKSKDLTVTEIQQFNNGIQQQFNNNQSVDIAKKYVHLSDIQHALKKPELYIGSVSLDQKEVALFDDSIGKIVYKFVNVVDGFIQIFEEILMNACDRVTEANYPKCNQIAIEVIKETGMITITNNGESIDVDFHPDFPGKYVPEVIFTIAKTGTHFDDNKQRLAGGSHGLGGKLALFFSKYFRVQVQDQTRNLYFSQEYYNNFSDSSVAQVIPNSGPSFVSISFIPDFNRFGGLTGIDDVHYAIMKKRAIDIAATAKTKNNPFVTVSFNGINISNSSGMFTYSSFYIPNLTDSFLEQKETSGLKKKSIGKVKSVANSFNNLSINSEDNHSELSNEQTQDPLDSNIKIESKVISKTVFTETITYRNTPIIIKVSEAYDMWDICAVYDPLCLIKRPNVSFVNSVFTKLNGPHMNHVEDILLTHIYNKATATASLKLKDGVEKKINKDTIRKCVVYFVSAKIPDPKFIGQTKDTIGNTVGSFQQKFNPSDKFLKAFINKTLLNSVADVVNNKNIAKLSKLTGVKGGKIKDSKHVRAGYAGNPNRPGPCTLIITEGDSAGAIAISGLNVLDKNFYGVWPMKGKLMNPRDDQNKLAEDGKQQMKTIVKLMSHLGLRIKKEGEKQYTSTRELNYDKIIILSDQDVDGSHIKGLVINFIHTFWPELLTMNIGYINFVSSPLVKLTKGDETKEFRSLSQYNNWCLANDGGKGWNVKYYKGLGTNDKKEAQMIFIGLMNKIITLVWTPQLEQEKLLNGYNPAHNPNDLCDDIINLIFAKEYRNHRKYWLTLYDENITVDYSQQFVSYYEFFNRDMIEYSVDSNKRGVPHLMDGLKPTPRMIVSLCLKRKLYGKSKEIKLPRLGGAVSEKYDYHHGEDILIQSVLGLAQDFPGANNIPWLTPSGNYGTRYKNGKDAAAARYLFTYLDPMIEYTIHDDDKHILSYRIEENEKKEPNWLCPDVPMILINGAEGIGTGWASLILPCDPHLVYQNIINYLDGQPMFEMLPFFRNFKGYVLSQKEANKFIITGAYYINPNEPDTIHITEIPVGPKSKSISDYKEFLEQMWEDAEEWNTNEASLEKERIANQKWITDSNGNQILVTPVNIPKRKGKKKNDDFDENENSNVKKKTEKEKSKNPLVPYLLCEPISRSTDVVVDFIVKFKPGTINSLGLTFIEKCLKLTLSVSNTNMVMYDVNGRIRKYDSQLQILKEFIDTKLEVVEKRRQHIIKTLNHEILILKCKLELFDCVMNKKTIQFWNSNGRSISKKLVHQQLEQNGFPKLGKKYDDNKLTYDWSIYNNYDMTTEHIEELNKKLIDLTNQLNDICSRSCYDIYRNDLNNWYQQYQIYDQEKINEFNQLVAGLGFSGTGGTEGMVSVKSTRGRGGSRRSKK